MSKRTLSDIENDIKSAVDAREARASVPSDDGKWDESRAIFIENCNERIVALVKERDELIRDRPDKHGALLRRPVAHIRRQQEHQMIKTIDPEDQATKNATYTPEQITETLRTLHQASLQLAAGFKGTLPVGRDGRIEALLDAASALNEMLLAVNHLVERLKES